MNITSTYKFLLFFFYIAIHPQNPIIHIKVLLKTIPLNDTQTYTFSSDNGLVLSCSQEPTKQYFLKKHLTITTRDNHLFINNKKNKSTILRIKALDGHISFEKNKYFGAFYIHINKQTLELINKLPLEAYITSVLRTEGWPGWPLETYKVLAIACRTYAIYQLQQARRKKQIYHLKPTNEHQTYYGTHSCQTIIDAVAETEGIFLAYKNKPIVAMFDSCCGGIIPAKMSKGINFKEAPYLARSYPCTYCKDLKIYSWQRDFSINTFIKRVQESFPALKNINTIETKHDKADIVQKVIIKDHKKTFELDGKKLYSLFPEIKSFSFSCTKKRNHIIIKGKGYGHHLGLCQWGANELVKEDWSYKRILHFYYPGTVLMRLTSKKDSVIE